MLTYGDEIIDVEQAYFSKVYATLTTNQRTFNFEMLGAKTACPQNPKSIP